MTTVDDRLANRARILAERKENAARTSRGAIKSGVPFPGSARRHASSPRARCSMNRVAN